MIENVLGPPLRRLSLYTRMPTIFLQTRTNRAGQTLEAVSHAAQRRLKLAVTLSTIDAGVRHGAAPMIEGTMQCRRQERFR